MQKWHINHVVGRSQRYTDHNRLYDGAAFSGPVVQYLAFRTLNHSSQVSETNQKIIPLSPKKARIQNSTREVQRLLGESGKPGPRPAYRAWKPEPPGSVNPQSLVANPSTSLAHNSRIGNHQARVQLGSQPGGSRFPSGHQRRDDFPSSAVSSVGTRPQNPGFRLSRGNATPRKPRSSRSSRNGSKSGNSSQDYENGPVEGKKRRGKSGRPFTMPPGMTDMDWNQEELDYLEAKEQLKIKPMVPYQPEQVSKETLSETVPAFTADERGMAAAVQQKLNTIEGKRDQAQERLEMLARLKIEGLKAKCLNNEEIEMVKKRVQQIGTGDNPQPQESHQISDELKAGFINSVFGGDHAIPHADEGDVMGNIEREMHRNMSYLPKDRASLLRKVQTLLPRARAATAKEPARART